MYLYANYKNGGLFMKLKKKLPIILSLTVLFIFAISSQIFAADIVTYSHTSTQLIPNKSTTMKFNVYLPPSFDENTNQKYHVLYLLHGAENSYAEAHNAWKNNNLKNIVDKVFKDNSNLKQMIIVMPNSYNETFYMNNYKNNNIYYEKYLYNELIPNVEKILKNKIESTSKNSAIAGLSMGGFGATYNGFKYADKFSSAYAMSGAIDLSEATPEITQNIAFGKIAYALSCANNDEYNYINSKQQKVYVKNIVKQFDEYLRGKPLNFEVGPNYKFDNTSLSGGHTWDFWKACLPDVIKFTSEHFN